jgi:hypothetical protein
VTELGGKMLRMCPVCCAGPLLNEACSDLRAHHGQCPKCNKKISGADAAIAAGLAKVGTTLGGGSGGGSDTVGDCLPRCPTCPKDSKTGKAVAVLFNGCQCCGHLFADTSWDKVKLVLKKNIHFFHTKK